MQDQSTAREAFTSTREDSDVGTGSYHLTQSNDTTSILVLGKAVSVCSVISFWHTELIWEKENPAWHIALETQENLVSAPEHAKWVQLSDPPLTSDVFSLGHTLYTSLEVAVPFSGKQVLVPCSGTVQLDNLCVLMEGKVFSHCSHEGFPPT